MGNKLKIIRTTSDDPDFHLLVTQLNAYLREQYGALQDYYSQFNAIDNIPNVVLIYHNGLPAGCACFKPFDAGSVELKRMFVTGSNRGLGIGKALIRELEKWAAELGYSEMVLEMGNRQPEAARLYTGYGFTVIPNYGPYRGMDSSICMQKKLVQTTAGNNS